ncbi:extracellular solute-binding protein [Streptomyces sp. NBC_00370]|uniref:extracellular solute-binding protein n=1 Tax=Streptomyces sp. NBC_00370 TaxID=2975728 RepID=UPI002E276318
MNSALSRRGFLTGVGGAAAGLALAGCGDGINIPAASNAKVELPTYIPYKGVPTSMPSSNAGITPGYLHYPANPVKSLPDGPPAKGPGIDIMTLIFNPVPPPADRNVMWDKLNKSVGTELNYQITPVGDYPNKFAVTIAGGDLPDAMLMLLQSASQRPQMLAALFQDLTEHLSGDNIRDYPYLANIPTASWAPTVNNGGIYGLPMPRMLSGGPMYTRMDLLKEKDLDPNPKNFKEFMQLCKDLTEPKKSRYALGDPITAFDFVMQMLHGPNQWGVKDGRFTYYFETEEAKQTLDAVRRLTKAGVMYPDAYSVVGKVKDWFGNGQIALNPDAPAAWNDFYTTYAAGTKDFELGYMMAPGFDGGPGVQWQGSANYAVLILKKAPKQRIKQILRAMNALAAPFGTDGYLLRKYGVQGDDHTLHGPDPILTPKGQSEVNLPTIFTTDAPQVLYYPAKPDIVPVQYAFQKAAIPVLMPNPAEPLYSATNGTIGVALKTVLDDQRKGIMQGRLPVGQWDGIMKKWRKDAGDKIRAEYEQAWENLHR